MKYPTLQNLDTIQNLANIEDNFSFLVVVLKAPQMQYLHKDTTSVDEAKVSRKYDNQQNSFSTRFLVKLPK